MSEQEAASVTPAVVPRAKSMNWIVWLFAAVGILGVLAFVFLVLMISTVRYGSQEAPPQKLAAKSPEENVSVVAVNDLKGTGQLQILIGTAGSDNPYGSYSASRGDDLRNMILLDKMTGDSRRLLPDNRRHIADISFFAPVAEGTAVAGTGGHDDPVVTETADAAGESPDVKKPKEIPVAYYALEVRTDPKHADLLVGDVVAAHQAFVLTGLDGVDRMWMQSPTRLAVLMRQQGKLKFRVIDLPSLKIVAAKNVETDR